MKTIGKHTPELSTYFTNMLADRGLYLQDASSHRDLSDSLNLTEHLVVYLPNNGISSAEDEQFSGFRVLCDLPDFNDYCAKEFDMEFEHFTHLLEFFEDGDCYAHELELQQHSDRVALKREKHAIFKEFHNIFEELKSDHNQLTHHMLKRIRDKADSLIASDF